jgi:hypothetical protein
MNGSDDIENIVNLLPEEHYVAHQLLVKIYPENDKILSAAIVMGGKKKGRKQCNNRVYGWLKKRLSESRKGKPGHSRSEETRKKMSESQKKVVRGPLTEESVRKRTETRKINGISKHSKPRTAEFRKQQSDFNLSKPLITCPHCNLSSRNLGNMRRYHLDNCKSIIHNLR